MRTRVARESERKTMTGFLRSIVAFAVVGSTSALFGQALFGQALFGQALFGQARTALSPADETVALLRRTAEALESRSIEPEEEAAFRALIVAAERLKTDDRASADERGRLRGLARARLRQAAEVLRRQEAKRRNVAAAPANARLPAASTLAQPGLPGVQQGLPGLATLSAAEEAEKLIDVITAVIAPESWEQNGGVGVIRYWALGHALVVRATAEEHDAVGDLAARLRRAR